MDKGGYSLKGAGVRRDVKVTVEGGAGLVQSFLRLVAAEGALLSKEPSAWTSAEGRAVAAWLELGSVASGTRGLLGSLRRRSRADAGSSACGLCAAPPVDRSYPSFGRSWDLSSGLDQELFWMLFRRLEPDAVHLWLPCERYSISGKKTPDPGDRAMKELAVRVLQAQGKQQKLGSLEFEDTWTQAFGPLISPLYPWQYAALDGCQYGVSRSLSDDSYG